MNNITKKYMAWPGFVKASSSVQHLYHKIDSTVENDVRVFPQSSARSSDCGYFFSLPDQLNAYPADKNVFAPLHKKRSHKKGSVNYHHKLPVNPLLFGYIFRAIFCVVRVQKDRNGKNSLIPCYRAEFLPEKFNLHAINDKVILLRAGLNISYDEGSRG